jgi:uncharacterized protein YycO
MPAITLQLSSMNDFVSEVIRAFDHGAYSHVDAVLADGTLLGARSDACGAAAPGVQIRKSGYAAFSGIKRVVLPTTVECEAAFYAYLQTQIGKPYDHSAILGFALNRDWREADSWFCSELVAAALEQAGYFSFALAAPANKITPADLLLAVSATAAV